jgi:hypothetical protein
MLADMIALAERFEGVYIDYAPGTPAAEMYDPVAEDRIKTYLGAIVVPDTLQELLHTNFLHIDGALTFNDAGQPEVGPVAADKGKDRFIGVFRAMVNNTVAPAGPIQGVWIPADVYNRTLEVQVAEQLGEGSPYIAPDAASDPGVLLGAAAVRFPYVLRPGGQPMDLPPVPAFTRLLRPGEEPFGPVVAEGDPERDFHAVNVIQAVYTAAERGEDRVMARIGLVWDGRSVPHAIHDQIVARRAGNPLYPETPLQIVQKLQAAV